MIGKSQVFKDLTQRFLTFFSSAPLLVTPKQSSTPYHWLTPDYYKDKVKTSTVDLDHMLGSFSKTKTAIMAVALTKSIRK